MALSVWVDGVDVAGVSVVRVVVVCVREGPGLAGPVSIPYLETRFPCRSWTFDGRPCPRIVGPRSDVLLRIVVGGSFGRFHFINFSAVCPSCSSRILSMWCPLSCAGKAWPGCPARPSSRRQDEGGHGRSDKLWNSPWLLWGSVVSICRIDEHRHSLLNSTERLLTRWWRKMGTED